MGIQKYVLKIDNPCSEDWDTMTENELGKFCSSCSKNVTDFTSLSNSEILAIYDKSPVKHCGRLTKSQLEKVFIQEEINRPTNILKVAAGLVLAFISKEAISSTTKFNSKPNVVNLDVNNNSINSSNNPRVVAQDSLQNSIEGLIIDSSNDDPMPFANVIIKGTNIATVSDFDGRFKLQIPDSNKVEQLVVVVSSIGYLTTETLFDRTITQSGEFVFVIASTEVFMGDVVIIKKKWWQRKR